MHTKFSKKFTLILLLLGAFFLSFDSRSQTPELTGRVVDQAELFSIEDKIRLTQMIEKYERETTHQMAILTVLSLSGESINVFSLRVAKSWGLGHKGINNGILIVLAPKERSVRIEVGTGLERYISNSRASGIIQIQMTPSFRKGEYSKGIELGLLELMKDGRGLTVR